MRRRLVSLAAATAIAVGAACSGDGAAGPDPTSGSSATSAAGTTPTTAPPATGATTTSAAATTTTSGPAPRPAEMAGLGDSYFPGLGNRGYDVQRYGLALDYDPETAIAQARATVDAVATEALDAFFLDYAGPDIDSVLVGGEPAAYGREGRELLVTPTTPVPAGETFRVAVAYSGRFEPTTTPGLPGVSVGWIPGSWGAVVMSQPDGASTWFPANDHPLDKATFRFRITVPSGYDVLANGVGGPVRSSGDRTTYAFTLDSEMAPYLATVVVADLDIRTGTGPGGLPLTLAVPAGDSDVAEAFDDVSRMIEVMSERFGPYPFSSYGNVVVPASLGIALENQTMSVFGTDSVAIAGESVVAHELAHQWFGDHVSVADWSDIWINEGFATFAEWLWSEETGGPTIREQAESVRTLADTLGFDPPADPGRADMFSISVYQRGGLVLGALHEHLGAERFDAVLQAWVTEYGGANASTDDFVRTAEEVSGEDLTAFFEDWLYGEDVPGELPPAS